MPFVPAVPVDRCAKVTLLPVDALVVAVVALAPVVGCGFLGARGFVGPWLSTSLLYAEVMSVGYSSLPFEN